MSILIDQHSKIIVQGITGAQGAFHARKMNEYSQGQVVGGVNPGRGGMSVSGIPVYDTIAALMSDTCVDASLIMVPPYYVLDAAWEAMEARIPLLVIVPEGVPVHDVMRIRKMAVDTGTTVIGPNTMGIIKPGKVKIGVMPESLYLPGKIGILSLLGTLNYETAWNLTNHRIGQSTCMGIGGDRLTGISIVSAMDLYMKDADTEALIIIGETPYIDVQGICDYLDSNGLHKPVFAFLAGRAAAVRYGDDFLKRFGNGGLYPISMNASISMLEDQGVVVVESMDILIPMLKTYTVQ